MHRDFVSTAQPWWDDFNQVSTDMADGKLVVKKSISWNIDLMFSISRFRCQNREVRSVCSRCDKEDVRNLCVVSCGNRPTAGVSLFRSTFIAPVRKYPSRVQPNERRAKFLCSIAVLLSLTSPPARFLWWRKLWARNRRCVWAISIVFILWQRLLPSCDAVHFCDFSCYIIKYLPIKNSAATWLFAVDCRKTLAGHLHSAAVLFWLIVLL